MARSAGIATLVFSADPGQGMLPGPRPPRNIRYAHASDGFPGAPEKAIAQARQVPASPAADNAFIRSAVSVPDADNGPIRLSAPAAASPTSPLVSPRWVMRALVTASRALGSSCLM